MFNGSKLLTYTEDLQGYIMYDLLELLSNQQVREPQLNSVHWSPLVFKSEGGTESFLSY